VQMSQNKIGEIEIQKSFVDCVRFIWTSADRISGASFYWQKSLARPDKSQGITLKEN
jgi:hypothetical protein